jgi:hypothetical protein
MKTKRSPVKSGHPESGNASQTSLKVGEVNLVTHTVATGGLVVIGGQLQSRLTPVQFAFLEQLVRQALEDKCKHASICGFVSSSVLICSLPWDSVHPEGSHLKQLVRRLRRRLAGTGITIEAMPGLGYRLIADGRSKSS